jgi:hypothetical protein
MPEADGQYSQMRDTSTAKWILSEQCSMHPEVLSHKTEPEIQDGGRQTGCTYNSEICKTCFNFAEPCHLMCTTSNVKCSIVDFTTVAYVIQPPYFLGPGNQRNHRRPIMLCYTNHIMTGNSKSTVNIYSL